MGNCAPVITSPTLEIRTRTLAAERCVVDHHGAIARASVFLLQSVTSHNVSKVYISGSSM